MDPRIAAAGLGPGESEVSGLALELGRAMVILTRWEVTGHSAAVLASCFCRTGRLPKSQRRFCKRSDHCIMQYMWG
jgi:hypothetical protein